MNFVFSFIAMYIFINLFPPPPSLFLFLSSSIPQIKKMICDIIASWASHQTIMKIVIKEDYILFILMQIFV